MRNADTESDQRVGHRIAINVRVEMTRQQMSQQTLADRIGWHQTRLSRRLTPGTTWVAFTVDELAEVATALGVPMTQLLPPELAALSA